VPVFSLPECHRGLSLESTRTQTLRPLTYTVAVSARHFYTLGRGPIRIHTLASRSNLPRPAPCPQITRTPREGEEYCYFCRRRGAFSVVRLSVCYDSAEHGQQRPTHIPQQTRLEQPTPLFLQASVRKNLTGTTKRRESSHPCSPRSPVSQSALPGSSRTHNRTLSLAALPILQHLIRLNHPSFANYCI
jgi:hypothetical protein